MKKCQICGNWIVGDSEERHRCNTATLLNAERDNDDYEPDDEERLALGSAILEASEDDDRYADDED